MALFYSRANKIHFLNKGFSLSLVLKVKVVGTRKGPNRPFPSSPGPLYGNEVKCSAFHMESHANKTHFHKKGCALGLILKVRVFGTRKWPIKVRRQKRWRIDLS